MLLRSMRQISFVSPDDNLRLPRYIPTGPLPVVPGDEEEGSSEDELEDLRSDSPCSEPVSPSDSLSASELRHRKRVEQREKLEAQVRDMKRRQQANEQWTQLKRSLYKPLFIAGAIVLGGGLISYFYFKN